MNAQNRYLLTSSGSRVGGRAFPALLTIGGLLAPLFAFVTAGIISDNFVNYAHRDDVLGVAFVVAFLWFFAMIVALWVWIWRASSKLREAEGLALAGDMRAKEAAHYALNRVFRADLRLRAFYTLGLLAERLGDFAEAADLFTRAGTMVPVTFTQAGRRAPLMCLGHASFCHAAAGDLGRATLTLQEAHRRIPDVYTKGVLEPLMDDSAYLGSASVSGNLNEIESRRDPRAMVALAGALLAFKNGHYRQCMDAAAGEDGMLRRNLMPHEGELVEALKTESLARMSGSEYRGGQIAGQLSEWTARAKG